MKLLRNIIYATLLLMFLIAGIIPRYRRQDVLKGFWSKLTGAVSVIPSGTRVVWFHAAGVGELMLCQPIIERLRKDHACLTFAITVFDGEALQVATTLFARDYIALVPYDFTWAVRRARQRIHPSLFLIAENDLWPNLISEIGESGTPILIFNTRMTAREQTEHRWNGWLIRSALRHVSWWGAVGKVDVEWIERLFSLRESAVEITGSLKFDGILREKKSSDVLGLRRFWGFDESETIFVAGSTHAPEEELILTLYQQLQPLYPQLRLILVPRNSARFEEVAAMLNVRKCSFLRVSKITEPVFHSLPVTLVDSLGQLREVWGLADLGFVGGTFSEHGGHNLVEPASYGVAFCFGPGIDNIRIVAEELLKHGAAIQVTAVDEFRETLQQWLEYPEDARAIGKKAQELVSQQGGALDVVLKAILQRLPDD